MTPRPKVQILKTAYKMPRDYGEDAGNRLPPCFPNPAFGRIARSDKTGPLSLG